MSTNPKLKLAEKSGVIVKKANVGRAGWIDVAGNRGYFLVQKIFRAAYRQMIHANCSSVGSLLWTQRRHRL